MAGGRVAMWAPIVIGVSSGSSSSHSSRSSSMGVSTSTGCWISSCFLKLRSFNYLLFILLPPNHNVKYKFLLFLPKIHPPTLRYGKNLPKIWTLIVPKSVRGNLSRIDIYILKEIFYTKLKNKLKKLLINASSCSKIPFNWLNFVVWPSQIKISMSTKTQFQPTVRPGSRTRDPYVTVRHTEAVIITEIVLIKIIKTTTKYF